MPFSHIRARTNEARRSEKKMPRLHISNEAHRRAIVYLSRVLDELPIRLVALSLAEPCAIEKLCAFLATEEGSAVSPKVHRALKKLFYFERFQARAKEYPEALRKHSATLDAAGHERLVREIVGARDDLKKEPRLCEIFAKYHVEFDESAHLLRSRGHLDAKYLEAFRKIHATPPKPREKNTEYPASIERWLTEEEPHDVARKLPFRAEASYAFE